MALSTPTQTFQAALFDDPGDDGQPQDDNPLAGTIEVPDPPEAPPVPDYPQMDVSGMDRPERNQDARNRQALTALLSAVGAGIAAGGDDPVMLNIASGLSQGASDQLENRREQFRQRQQAFDEFLTEARRFNAEQRAKEAEARYDRQVSQYEAQQDAYHQALDARNEDVINRREHRRDVEMQRLENRQDADGGETDDADAADNSAGALTYPQSPEKTQSKIDALIRKEQRMAEQGAGNSDLRPIQDKIVKLKRHRDILLRRRSDTTATGTPDVPNTTGQRRGRAAPADTSDAPVSGRTPAEDESLIDDAMPVRHRGSDMEHTEEQHEPRYQRELNSTLRQRGPSAALNKLADDLEAGRITQRQADRLFQQIAPDSTRRR